MDTSAEGWYLDPCGVHEQRWISAGRPTSLVKDGEKEAKDEPPATAPAEPFVRPAVVERPLALADGAMIFDAAMKVRDIETQYGIALPEDPAYETVGGFVLNRLGFIPRGGESFETDGYRFTVMEMDRRRVSRVKIKSIRPAQAQASSILPAETAIAVAKSEKQESADATAAGKERRGK